MHVLSPRYIVGTQTASHFPLGTLEIFSTFFDLSASQLSLISHVFVAGWALKSTFLAFGWVICVGYNVVLLRHALGAHLHSTLKFASERRWDIPDILKRQQLNEILNFLNIVFSTGMSFYALSRVFAAVSFCGKNDEWKHRKEKRRLPTPFRRKISGRFAETRIFCLEHEKNLIFQK